MSTAGTRTARLGRFVITALAVLLAANLLWMWRSCEALSPIGPGKRAPDFKLTRLDGTEVRLADLRGKVVMLSFWATWCTPCVMEFPAIERLARRFADRGLVVLAVNLDETRRTIEQFKQASRTDLDLVLDDGSTAGAYWVDTIPTLVVIDHQGIVRAREQGLADESRLAARLDPILRAASGARPWER